MMADPDIPLITGVVGATTGTLALVWTLWKDSRDRATRVRLDAAFARWRNEATGRAENGIVVVATNTGRTTVLLDGVGVHGVALSEDKWADVHEADRQRVEFRNLPRRPRYKRRSGPLAREAIRLEAGDAFEAKLPCDLDGLSSIDGEYWGVDASFRDGRSVELDGDFVNGGIRDWPLPLWVLKRLPRRLRLKKWYRDHLDQARRENAKKCPDINFSRGRPGPMSQ